MDDMAGATLPVPVKKDLTKGLGGDHKIESRRTSLRP